MARRLTDTYFVKCSFSIRFETSRQIVSTNKSLCVYVIPEMESITEYVKTAIEQKVKYDFGNDYKIADFVITEITPL